MLLSGTGSGRSKAMSFQKVKGIVELDMHRARVRLIVREVLTSVYICISFMNTPPHFLDISCHSWFRLLHSSGENSVIWRCF